MAFTFDQISALLNSIVQDATGRTPTQVIRSTKDFVDVAEMALSVGTDPIMNSISQVIARTVIKARPYKASVSMLDQDSLRYGNVVRLLTPIFVDSAIDQPMYNSQPADGQSTDHYKIKRPQALETRMTGFKQWMVQAPTVFEDQLRSAFDGPEQLGDFMAGLLTKVSNEIESQKETLARNTIANFIAGKIARNNAGQIHLLTEYNALIGDTLTIADIYKPANFESFVKWLYARIADISNLFTVRSVNWHEGITGYTIMRHTPKEAQRLLMFSNLMEQIKTMALSGIYHENLLDMKNAEGIEYWQNLDARTSIKANASYTAADGTRANAEVEKDNVIGVLFDRDAMGINIALDSVNTTPMNAAGRYYNTFYHFTRRYYNDNTENAVVFILD